MTRKNLPNNIIANKIARRLKYLSIKYFIGSPYNFIRKVTSMNLAALLIAPASKNMGKFMPNAPELTVKSLNGIGVNQAVKIIMKLY